jgi:hypothetical protein
VLVKPYSRCQAIPDCSHALYISGNAPPEPGPKRQLTSWQVTPAMPGDIPNEADHLTRDRRGDDGLCFAGLGEAAISIAEPHLCFPRDLAERDPEFAEGGAVLEFTDGCRRNDARPAAQAAAGASTIFGLPQAGRAALG